MTRIGAHVSINNGLLGALKKATDMGANCIQIFSSPPQSFVPPRIALRECVAFRKEAKKRDIQPIFIHAAYLINLASVQDRLRKLSITSLIDDLKLAEKIGAKGSIVHTGSHKGKGFAAVLSFVVSSIQQILAESPETTKLYLEITSGSKGKIGSTFEELQRMLAIVRNPRLGVCLDTAHLFAGGYAFDTGERIAELAKKIETSVGWQVVECLHANDSKVPFGSGLDRHENIGEGYIGKEPFTLLLHHPKFSQLPFIDETPGFDDKGPDKRNLDILKSLKSGN